MRLIDADALKHEIAKVMPSRTEVSLVVDGMPDAIVRCKDCKYVCFCDTTEILPDIPVFAKCTLTDEVHGSDWFCADGVKRDNE